MGDQRMFADPLVGLAQRHPDLLRQPDQPFPRATHEFGVGRVGHPFGRTVLKSDGFAAPVWVAVARLSWISAVNFSSPIRGRQRVSGKRSKDVSEK
jgi:hypothetical protein